MSGNYAEIHTCLMFGQRQKQQINIINTDNKWPPQVDHLFQAFFQTELG